MTQPLNGVTVLDLTQIYNGPYATFLMAMAGAELARAVLRDGTRRRQRKGIVLRAAGTSPLYF